MDEVLDYNENANQGLPVFLKVLCILTFVGAGLGIISSLYGLMTIESNIQQLERSQEILNGSNSPFNFGDMSGVIEATRKWGAISYSLTLAGNLLCLGGALLMWRLKRIGFFTYILGHILPFIGSSLMMSGDGMGSGSGFMAAASTFGMVIAGLFSAAFIIMYGVNYKHLK